MEKRLLASVATAACLSMSSAWAADEPAEPDTGANAETITVTGARGSLKRPAEGGALGDKPILDTPFSVTVIDAAEIARRQPQTIAQIFVNDPSVFSFATPGTVNWWGTQIRGLGVRNYYVDGTPLLLYWGGDFPLEAVETVQALKGSTGFMYGFGAPGGAILYQTKRSTDAPLLTGEIGWRGRSAFSAHVDAGGPVGEGGLGYRFNAAVEGGEEYNASEIDRAMVSLALDYEITPDVTWRATALYEDYELRAEPFHIYWPYATPMELPRVPTNWDNLNVDNSFYRYDMWSVATDLEWRFVEDWSVRLNYGYTRKLHNSNKMFIDFLNTPNEGDYSAFVYQFADLTYSHLGQIIVSGEFETGAIRHEIVAGAAAQFSSDDFGAGALWDTLFEGNIYEPQPHLTTGPYDYSMDPSFPFEERQNAVFISDTLHFGDFQALIGFRHTIYDLEDVDGDPTVDSGYGTKATTPTYALIYKPVDNATIYASYVESLEGGTIVGQDYANFGEVLDATVSKQFEFGGKYESAALSLTAAVFRVDRATQIDQRIDGERYLTQDGRTIYDGVEVIGRIRVGEDLTLGLGAVFLDARIKDVSEGNEDLAGNRPAETYESQFVASVEYDIAAVEGLSLHANVRYFGDAPSDDTNMLILPSYTLAGAGFVYETEIGGREIVITGNINNLLNEKYWGLQNFGETINGSLSVKVGL